MHQVSGGCHCGNILVNLQLANEPASYRPRACDCDFCRKHGAAYISDPRGLLRLQVSDPQQRGTYRQGNGLAEMLLCTRCGVLIGALYRSEDRIYATVNVKIIEGTASFGAEQPVSPKKLAGADKISRWTDLWFANVELR